MKLERTFQGLEATLKVSGGSRFSGAIFLVVWLTFWVVGEGVVLGILFWGAWCLLTGQPPGAGKAPLQPGPAIATGLFLLFWVSFWTLGGVLAWRELLRLLFGRDRLLVRPDALEVIHGYGLFSTRRLIPREQLLRFYRPHPGNLLSAETTTGTVEISRLGTAGELDQLVAELNAEFKLSPQPIANGVLPDAWRELDSPEGDKILVQNPATRRKLALVMWVVTLILLPCALYLLSATRSQSSLGALAAIISAVTALATWGAYHLTWCRNEWRLTHGRIVLQKRKRGRAAATFEAATLQLREDKDSDGDLAYKLVAIQAGAPEFYPLSDARHQEKTIWTSSSDPTDLRNLGRWLAGRCTMPLADRTTVEAKAEDFEVLKQQLAASGRLGKWAALLLARLKPRA